MGTFFPFLILTFKALKGTVSRDFFIPIFPESNPSVHLIHIVLIISYVILLLLQVMQESVRPAVEAM